MKGDMKYLEKYSVKIGFSVFAAVLIVFSYHIIGSGRFESFELRGGLAETIFVNNETISTLQSTVSVPHKSLGDCQPARRLVFVKTHKTGGSSLNTILAKHFRRYNIKKKAAYFPSPFVGGYPGKFRSDFCFVASFHHLCTDADKALDVLQGHFRFDEDAVKAVVKPDAKYITVMRNPMRVFESAFYFYYKRNKRGGYFPMSCQSMPYEEILKTSDSNYSEYIAAVTKKRLMSTPWNFRSKSYQAYDLGLDPENEDDEYILNQAQKLDRIFDFVFITDYFKQSLILLRSLLCMKWEDIIPTCNKKGDYAPHSYSHEEAIKVKSLLKQDILLYNYFNATFWRKVHQYGEERMEKDLKTLDFFTKKLQQKNYSVPVAKKRRSANQNFFSTRL